jgi:hypothetical protein
MRADNAAEPKFAAAARGASSCERNRAFVPVEVQPLPVRRSATPPCRLPITPPISSFSCLRATKKSWRGRHVANRPSVNLECLPHGYCRYEAEFRNQPELGSHFAYGHFGHDPAQRVANAHHCAVISFCVGSNDFEANYGGDGRRNRTRACLRSVQGVYQGCIRGEPLQVHPTVMISTAGKCAQNISGNPGSQ